MKHICDESKFVIVKEEGNLITYKCPECNKDIYCLGSIPVDYKELKKCKVYVQWSDSESPVIQINNLKKLIPNIKEINNIELLNMARKNINLDLGEMYLPEANELVKEAVKRHISLIIKVQSTQISDYKH